MMGRSQFACLVGLVLIGTATAGDEAKVLNGKVRPATTGVTLVTSEGTEHAIVETDVSRLLFLDKTLHDRAVRLTATIDPKTKAATLTRVQTVKAGKVFDLDYWCDRCQLAARQPGKCICCGADVVLRELPAK